MKFELLDKKGYVYDYTYNGYILIQNRYSLLYTKTKTRKYSLNKRAVTSTLELDEGNVSTFAKIKYERSSFKTKRVFEKTNMISCFFFRKEDNLQGLKSISC